MSRDLRGFCPAFQGAEDLADTHQQTSLCAAWRINLLLPICEVTAQAVSGVPASFWRQADKYFTAFKTARPTKRAQRLSMFDDLVHFLRNEAKALGMSRLYHTTLKMHASVDQGQ